MKKILAALLVLALVAPAMAAVTITATDAGSQKLQIKLTTSGTPTPAVRGLALWVTVTGGNVANAAAYTTPASAFNTFVDYATLDPAGYVINKPGQHPFANELVKGIPTFPIPSGTKFSLSMGYLDETSQQLGLNGTDLVVATIQLSGIADNGSASVAIVADTIRGGVVGNDLGTVTYPSVTTVAGPVVVTETITGTLVVVKDTVAPAVAGKVNAARLESFTASGVASSLGHGLQYQFTWGDGNVSTWGAATQTHMFTTATTAAWTANVTVQARCATDNAVVSAVSAAIDETGEAVKSSAAFYADWATYGRPVCWAFQRQCNGDATGTQAGPLWVSLADLAVFKAAFNQGTLPVGGICADFNHAAAGPLRVSLADLTIFKTYFNQGTVPVCSSTNYNFWTN